jgi:hypothetical protein
MDVRPERDAVERAVRRINAARYNGSAFELIRWENDFYTADKTFQDQIARPAETGVPARPRSRAVLLPARQR